MHPSPDEEKGEGLRFMRAALQEGRKAVAGIQTKAKPLTALQSKVSEPGASLEREQAEQKRTSAGESLYGKIGLKSTNWST
jgi:hypothetical protein